MRDDNSRQQTGSIFDLPNMSYELTQRSRKSFSLQTDIVQIHKVSYVSTSKTHINQAEPDKPVLRTKELKPKVSRVSSSKTQLKQSKSQEQVPDTERFQSETSSVLTRSKSEVYDTTSSY